MVNMLPNKRILNKAQKGTPNMKTTGLSSTNPTPSPTTVVTASSSVNTAKAARRTEYRNSEPLDQ